MSDPQTASLSIAAALLRQGRTINLASCCFTLAALAGALLGSSGAVPLVLLLAAILLGMAQVYLAIRVGFDAALFDGLAQQAAGAKADLAAFDRAMLALGLLPAEKVGRDVAPRIVGARRLFSLQIAAMACQGAAIVAAILLR
jgi:hypothetical protein